MKNAKLLIRIWTQDFSSWGTWLTAFHCWRKVCGKMRKEEKKARVRWDLKPKPLNHEARALPLCYIRCSNLSYWLTLAALKGIVLWYQLHKWPNFIGDMRLCGSDSVSDNERLMAGRENWLTEKEKDLNKWKRPRHWLPTKPWLEPITLAAWILIEKHIWPKRMLFPRPNCL